VKSILLGAGASNTTIARLIITDGGDPSKIIMFDTKGGLHAGREDIKKDARNYRKWELCEKTNPQRITTMEDAIKGADVLIALSTPGPDTVKREWIRAMAPKAIVFTCANPVPEIWPYAAKEEGAFIVATGRGDFPNQVNNVLGFPGIFRGALDVRASEINEPMKIAASWAIAGLVEKVSEESIIPSPLDRRVVPAVAEAVRARPSNLGGQEVGGPGRSKKER